VKGDSGDGPRVDVQVKKCQGIWGSSGLEDVDGFGEVGQHINTELCATRDGVLCGTLSNNKHRNVRKYVIDSYYIYRRLLRCMCRTYAGLFNAYPMLYPSYHPSTPYPLFPYVSISNLVDAFICNGCDICQ
jgi:hypothetical protein